MKAFVFLIVLTTLLFLASCGEKNESTQKSIPDDKFVATFVCGPKIGGEIRHVNLVACFEGRRGGINTVFEFKNGEHYASYKGNEIARFGKITPIGVEFYLQQKFEITAQNTSPDLLLKLQIKGEETGNIYFDESVGRFEVIKIKN